MKKFHIDYNDRIKKDNRNLYRIIADKDFYNVNIGDKGGYISKEVELSQEDTCWVYDGCYVSGKVTIDGDCHIMNNSYIHAIQQANIFLHDDIIISESELYTYNNNDIYLKGFISIKKSTFRGSVMIESMKDLLYIFECEFNPVNIFAFIEYPYSDTDINIITKGGNFVRSKFFHDVSIVSNEYYVHILNSILTQNCKIVPSERITISESCFGRDALITDEKDFISFDYYIRDGIENLRRIITFHKDKEDHAIVSIVQKSDAGTLINSPLAVFKQSGLYKKDREFFQEIELIILGRFWNDFRKGE